MDTLRRWIPALGWIRSYDRADISGDLSAGVTVAVMLIPQAMAYALLAGLPPIAGLYAALFPLLAYALLGTSRQLAVGPVAMDSLLVAAGVATLALPGTPEYVALAVLLAGMVGALQVAMGLLRLGVLVTFLARPVISGFTSAAAIVIGLSQLGHLLGVRVHASTRAHELIGELAGALDETHMITALIGGLSVTLLLALKRIKRRIPGALMVVVLGALATWGFDLEARGVEVVGAVPAGLPSPRVPQVTLEAMGELFPIALTLALVGFMESVSIAKAFARLNKYEIDANQELRALGAANLTNAFFGGYPVAGGFSRSAVNAQAGSRTPLSSALTAALIAVSLLLLTPAFRFLPKATLAAIVIAAVIGLVDVDELRRLWKVKRADAFLMALTFLVTLFVGIQQGIAAGVVASLLLFVVRSTRPHNAVLGRLPGSTDYRNIERFPEATEVPCVTIWRFDASFYFANADFFRDQVDRLLVRGEPPMRALVLDAAGINDIDASAQALLHDIHARLGAAGIQLYLANVKGPVRDVMNRGGLTDAIGQERFFFSVHAAVQAAEADLGTADAPSD